MRILKLKFSNINSLAGAWEIDFNELRFTSNGLFAITGKTGAGKSSILDAISLALYGKTPRVDITGQSNDVMTRGTNSCYSEIVFEVGGKTWKSSWKQERTRTGTLKPVSRQIADDANKIVADQVRSCDTKILEILGLPFDLFTKVILLAQGSFAAFLQAGKNDKGALLEQITGTKIYGEISQKVFERNKMEQEKLEQINIQLGAIKILSEEEIQSLKAEIAELENKNKFIDSDLQSVEKAKKWLVDLENLQKQISGLKQKLPDLEQKAEAAKEASEKSKTNLQSAKNEKDETDKILTKVRELDTKIGEKDKTLNPILLSIRELENNKAELSQNINNQKNNLQKTQDDLKKTQDWAAKNAKYESLGGRFAAVENQNLQVIGLLNDFNAKYAESDKANKDLEKKTSIFNKSVKYLAEKEKVLNDKQQELELTKSKSTKILAGKELSDYQSEKEKITQFGIQLKELIVVSREILSNKVEIEKYRAIIQKSEQEEDELKGKIDKNNESAKILDSQIILLDENIKLAKAIQSLDEHRKSLEDGKPCPLCGSIEHPFARGNEPKIGEKESELKRLRTQYDGLVKSVQDNEKTVAKLQSDKNNALSNSKKEDEKLSKNKEKRNLILSEIRSLNPDFLIPEGENALDLLEEIRSEKQTAYKQISSLISNAEECEKQIKTLRDVEVPQLNAETQTAKDAKTAAETACKLAEQQVRNQEDATKEAKERYESQKGELMKVFEEYGVSDIENLKKCLVAWNTNTKKNEELNAKITEFDKDILLITTKLEDNAKLLSEKQTEKQVFEIERQTLYTQRVELFGVKNTEEEEIRLKKMLDAAETAKNQTEQTEINSNTELAKIQAVILEKEKESAASQAEKITEKSLDELQIEYADKKKLTDEYSQKIGANRQALSANDENLAKTGKKREEQETQQQICKKWGNLNELIGSHKGDKYRTFAQSLTFEHLIALANLQLKKMSERYILKRTDDTSNPFDLLVIDKFQNCDERTSQNLSGGEKFIVSLSLALGLTNMTSRNMKIDTMFIDEGFGTLDSDYLDVALSALSNLQHEGKLIGVISHLTELKERIATHIEVTPKGNGYSELTIRN